MAKRKVMVSYRKDIGREPKNRRRIDHHYLPHGIAGTVISCTGRSPGGSGSGPSRVYDASDYEFWSARRKNRLSAWASADVKKLHPQRAQRTREVKKQGVICFPPAFLCDLCVLLVICSITSVGGGGQMRAARSVISRGSMNREGRAVPFGALDFDGAACISTTA